jgi:hypothetical protein
MFFTAAFVLCDLDQIAATVIDWITTYRTDDPTDRTIIIHCNWLFAGYSGGGKSLQNGTNCILTSRKIRRHSVWAAQTFVTKWRQRHLLMYILYCNHLPLDLRVREYRYDYFCEIIYVTRYDRIWYTSVYIFDDAMMSLFDYVVWTILTADRDDSFAIIHKNVNIIKQYPWFLRIDLFLRSFWSKHSVRIATIRHSIFYN